jgi:exoribonuclease R
MIGTIACIKNRYVLLDEAPEGKRRHLNDTPIVKTLLPDDHVHYHIADDRITITSLSRRERQLHIGIVNRDTFYFPQLPTFFTVDIDTTGFTHENIVLFVFDNDGVRVHHVYESARNRQIDLDLIQRLYSPEVQPEIRWIPTDRHLYTTSFQDLTSLPSFNVDPTKSKDFDDAISVVDNHIYVHIVDITHFYTDLPAYEQRAFQRSFTLYTPEGNTNLIPDFNAEYTLSLIKGERRRVITVEFVLDDESGVRHTDIYPSVVIIKKRYDYDQFNDEMAHPSFLTVQQIDTLRSFTTRYQKPTLAIPYLQYDIKDGQMTACQSVVIDDLAHKIIETVMIQTNHAVSTIADLPQRFHPQSEDVSVIDDELVNQLLVVKKYQQAHYQYKKGHFGLSLDEYTHFTSPIRRYFDVVIHRLVAGWTCDSLPDILSYLSRREKQIKKWTRFYQTLKIIDYMDRHAPATYDGHILSVVPKGVVVVIMPFLYEQFICTTIPYTTGEHVRVEIVSIHWPTLSVRAQLA